jgi:hypothetical protein
MGSVAPLPSTQLPEDMYSPGLHGWHGAHSLVSGANVSPLHLARMYVLYGHLKADICFSPKNHKESKGKHTEPTETRNKWFLHLSSHFAHFLLSNMVEPLHLSDM